MRQIMNDGALSTEFVKSRFAEKPSITNNIDTGDFRSVFNIGAAGLTYNNGSAPARITNTTEVVAPGIGPSNARFDVSASAQRPHITAGQYTYSNGPATRGADGTYNYSEGSFNLDINWSAYFDHSAANPWAYPENRPAPP
jgi:hypothetical protein